MRVYVSKYALTQGIIRRFGRMHATKENVFDCGNNEMYDKPYWSEVLDEALIQAEKMRAKKLRNLLKQYNKVRKIKFIDE